MKPNSTTLPSDLDRYLGTNSAADITSTASYVERGGALVTPASLTVFRSLRAPLQTKIAGLRDNTLLRTRLEVLAVYIDEFAAERATLTPAICEAAFALLYFLKGFDRIPDSVPEVGLLDDAMIVQAVTGRHTAAIRMHWQRHQRAWPLEE